MGARILVVDDEREVGNFFSALLELKGHQVEIATNGKQASEAFNKPFHLALIDLKLPDINGLTLLRDLKNRQPDCEAVMMTGYATVKSAVEAIQLGAFDFLEKPFCDIASLEKVIEGALTRAATRQEGFLEQRKQLLQSLGFITGYSDKMQRLLLMAEKLAQKNITILLRGETGTGKELLARYIHAVSPRAEQPFFAINCGALPDSLLESELFGYEKGAFTGATGQRKGIFELAHRGTLFLDEIGDASLAIQVKLLRVLETGEILRVGGEKPVRVDVRVIAATNADLEGLVKQKRFREDLFYRLDVVTLTLPPLRERQEDIPLLAEYFLKRHCLPGKEPQLSLEVIKALQNYEWPGNIRELANTIARVAVVCNTPVVLREHLPPKICNKGTKLPEYREGSEKVQNCVHGELFSELQEKLRLYLQKIDLSGGFDLPRFLLNLKQMEIDSVHFLIDRALKESLGKYPVAAKLLKTTPRTLRYLRKEKVNKDT